jgi:hypothetical protein
VNREHLLEEIEDLGKSERSAVRSHLQRMLMHLIKEALQPEHRGRSWRESAPSARTGIHYRLADLPSLHRVLKEELESIYQRAVKEAAYETELPRARRSEISQ